MSNAENPDLKAALVAKALNRLRNPQGGNCGFTHEGQKYAGILKDGRLIIFDVSQIEVVTKDGETTIQGGAVVDLEV